VGGLTFKGNVSGSSLAWLKNGHQGLSHAAMQHRNRSRWPVARFKISLPILDTLQKKNLCWLVDIPINSNKLKNYSIHVRLT
jgi:hypothetical protein